MIFNTSYPLTDFTSLADSYDYIILGGGSAGCVLANRLSAADPHTSVLVIERGDVSDNWLTRIPLFSSDFHSDGSRSQVWRSAPQKLLNNRAIEMVRGNSLGGSSRINAMLYTRGVPGEYNAWAAAGRRGWGYDDLLPYFIKSETDLDCQYLGNKSTYHGDSGMKTLNLKSTTFKEMLGPWFNRSHLRNFWEHTRQIVQATSALGLPYVEDSNSPLEPPHGCTKLHYNIDSKGRRSSTFSAFLPPELVRERQSRLHICTRTVVLRIGIIGETAASLSAEGVWIQKKDQSSLNKPRFIQAKREVILATGPIGSPQILMLSGIGPADHLGEHGIEVIKDMPGVGSNLYSFLKQDHPTVSLQFKVPMWDSLTQIELRPWVILKHLFLYLFFGTGIFLAPVLELAIFLQSRLLDETYRLGPFKREDLDASLPENRPDIEIMPISWADTKYKSGGLSFFTVVLKPSSTGTVRLVSKNPFDSPQADPHWLSTESDCETIRRGVRFALRLKDQIVAQGYPIKNINVPDSNSDEDIDRFARLECRSTYHYASSCRMAPEDDPQSPGVVDDRLRVHGIQNLRIADSSIFPDIVGAHLAAATVAVAEKCADMILQDYKQPL
ncbi:hypothetical protein Clacol_004847 [Clathrus columnatus]|uniref:Glucose-methanol-choline oxidoreductase N-terminal domain-containing protein n=1 Tax=Clathrus columnatus TaxID=1419009 RepID=A0AAV5A8J8_9AGAM|nr:hypothetical protein Clacol_004847 [Clathrus columnatus]